MQATAEEATSSGFRGQLMQLTMLVETLHLQPGPPGLQTPAGRQIHVEYR